MAKVFAEPSYSTAPHAIIEGQDDFPQPVSPRTINGKRQVAALESVDLEIARGEMVSIVGPSGSGKSTLLNLIGGLDRPSSGRDPHRRPVRRRPFRRRPHPLAPRQDRLHLPVLQSSALAYLRGKRGPARCTSKGLGRARRSTSAPASLLELVQLGQPPRPPARRTLRRRAPARRHRPRPGLLPPVLLADEPTGNLDTHTGAEILALIHDLHERLNATVLIVTHDTGVAESCARTVTLRDARIAGDVRR